MSEIYCTDWIIAYKADKKDEFPQCRFMVVDNIVAIKMPIETHLRDNSAINKVMLRIPSYIKKDLTNKSFVAVRYKKILGYINY